MALVVYVGKSDAVQLADGTECRNGVPVKVADDLAVSLLRQDTWRKADPPKTAPVADNPKE